VCAVPAPSVVQAWLGETADADTSLTDGVSARETPPNSNVENANMTKAATLKSVIL